MRVIIASVCDHAWVENGCLSLCRAFDTIMAAKFPHNLARLSIALRLLIRRSETGEHKLKVSLADSDGKKLLGFDLNITAQNPPESLTETSFSLALNAQNITFPQAGDYVVDILIDARVEASIPIYVREKKST